MNTCLLSPEHVDGIVAAIKMAGWIAFAGAFLGGVMAGGISVFFNK